MKCTLHVLLLSVFISDTSRNSASLLPCFQPPPNHYHTQCICAALHKFSAQICIKSTLTSSIHGKPAEHLCKRFRLAELLLCGPGGGRGPHISYNSVQCSHVAISPSACQLKVSKNSYTIYSFD